MQLDAELTLEKALAMARQTEAVRQQQPVVRGVLQQDCPTVEHEKIDALNYNSKNAHKQRPPRNHTGVGPPNRQQTKQKCGRCGKSQQKIALAKNVTKEATFLHAAFQRTFHS